MASDRGCCFFFSSRRRHTRFDCDWSSDVCSSDLKGMAATMGYARVTDLAHRAENLLDLVRRGGRPATDDLLQLLFRARDALEHAVELSVVEREDEIDVAEDRKSTRLNSSHSQISYAVFCLKKKKK